MTSELAPRQHQVSSGRRRSRRRSASQRLLRRLTKRRVGQVALIIALAVVSLAAAYWVTQQQ